MRMAPDLSLQSSLKSPVRGPALAWAPARGAAARRAATRERLRERRDIRILLIRAPRGPWQLSDSLTGAIFPRFQGFPPQTGRTGLWGERKRAGPPEGTGPFLRRGGTTFPTGAEPSPSAS